MTLSDIFESATAYRLYRSAKSKVRNKLHLHSGCNAPLHRDEAIAPFFIVGSGRAGTTLLRRVLQSNDTVHIPPEIWSFQQTYNRFLRYRSILSWTDIVALLTLGYISESDFDDGFHDCVFRLMQDLADLPEQSRTLASFINMVNRRHGQYRGATFERWGDKTPLNSFCLHEVLDVFPDAKFIHLVRDPADIVRSYLKYDLVPDVETGARRWQRAVRSVFEFSETSADHANRVLEIQYEDFVSHPKLVTKSICDFLDLDYRDTDVGSVDHRNQIDEVDGRDHHANVFKPISTKHIGKGRRELDTKTLRRLDSLIGEDCVSMGYDPLV